MKMTLMPLMAVSAVMWGCGVRNGADEKDSLIGYSVTTTGFSEKTDEWSRIHSRPEAHQSKLLVVTDTIRFSNGCRKVTVTGIGPQNRYSVTTDRRGQTVKTFSQASETDGQILFFDYGEEGKLCLVTECYADICGEIVEQLHEYAFNYDGEGCLVEISRTVLSEGMSAPETIRASEGNCLEGDFRPVEDFWISDLHGGRLELHIKETSCCQKEKSGTLRSWINFESVAVFDDPQIMPKEFLGMPEPITF